jgi:hypothetical protein
MRPVDVLTRTRAASAPLRVLHWALPLQLAAVLPRVGAKSCTQVCVETGLQACTRPCCPTLSPPSPVAVWAALTLWEEVASKVCAWSGTGGAGISALPFAHGNKNNQKFEPTLSAGGAWNRKRDTRTSE